MFEELNIDAATIACIIKAKKGFDDTISQRAIADEFMIRRNAVITPRKVRKIIGELIKCGYPILSTPHFPGGYYWGGSNNEAIECYRRLRKKGIKILIRARQVLRNHNNGQLKLNI